MEEKDYSGTWKIDFTCPHCGGASDIYAEEWCLVINRVGDMVVNGYETDEVGNLTEVDDVGVEWGKSDIQEGGEGETFHCYVCREEIDPEITDKQKLFNWLYKRGMVCQVDGTSSGFTPTVETSTVPT